MPDIEEITLTTNGTLLSHYAEALAEAGLSRIKVSLDTLRADRFRQITRWGNIDDVWRGIEAAEAALRRPARDEEEMVI